LATYTIHHNLLVDGALTTVGDVNVGGSVVNFTGSMGVASCLLVSGSLNTTGCALIGGAAIVTGSLQTSSSLKTTGCANIGGALSVTGSTSLTGSLVAAGGLKVGATACPGNLTPGIFFGIVAGCVPAMSGSNGVAGSIAIAGAKTGGTIFVQLAQQTGSTGASGVFIGSASVGNGGASLMYFAGLRDTDASTMFHNYIVFNAS
jgi:hypothetical protein